MSNGAVQCTVEMAERSKAAASGAVPLRRARVRTSLSIKAGGLYLFFFVFGFSESAISWNTVRSELAERGDTSGKHNLKF